MARPGAFERWMRRRGRVGGQNKVPRVDNSGLLTRDLIQFLGQADLAGAGVSPVASTPSEVSTSGTGVDRRCRFLRVPSWLVL
jgi:hypothetical protein